jgi:hypothetical protein
MEPDPNNPIRLNCIDLRNRIRDIGGEVVAAKREARGAATANVSSENWGEMLANYMLAYRHLEDARMRLGKVIQALEGGVSIFDK